MRGGKVVILRRLTVAGELSVPVLSNGLVPIARWAWRGSIKLGSTPKVQVLITVY